MTRGIEAIFNPATGGATQPGNPDITYEKLGFAADGQQQTVTAGSANTKGSYQAFGASNIASAWSGFVLEIGIGSGSSFRYLIDIRYLLGTGTTTIATPGVVTLPSGHGRRNGDAVSWSTTGALPTGFVAATTYFIINLSGNTCNLATTKGGSAINTTGSQSGTHSIYHVPVVSFFYHPGTAETGFVRFPLKLPAGVLPEARVQSNSGSATIKLALHGEVASSTTAPGFDQLTALNVDATNTLPSTVNVPLQSSGPTWTALVASTDEAYGAMMVVMDYAGTTHTSAQNVDGVIATGAASSEVEFARIGGYCSTTTNAIQRAARLLQRNTPVSTRITAGCLATTPNSDNVRIGVYGAT